MAIVSFRTDEELKKEASRVFEALGLNLSTALNMFLKQTVIQQKYPCSLELDIVKDAKDTYDPEFFALFGKGANLGFDEEPVDLPPEDINL